MSMLSRKCLLLFALALALALAFAPLLARADPMARAQSAIEQGQYSVALTQLKPLVARGDVRAEEALGALYDAGLGVAPDPVRAAKLFREAALQGSGAAQINLANLYLKGRGVQADPVLAYAWADAAAASGEPGGQDLLDRLAREMPRGQLKRAQSLAQRYVELYAESFRSG
jgi:TPR repeat protein